MRSAGWSRRERTFRDLESCAEPVLSRRDAVAARLRSPVSCRTLAILEERRAAFRARRDRLVPALRELGFGGPGHAERRILRVCGLLAVSDDANSFAATCSTAPAWRSRPVWISDVIARVLTSVSRTRSTG